MNLIEKIKNYFTPSKIKELEEKIAQIQKNQIKDVLHPIKFEFKGIAEEKLIQKCIYNVGTKNIDVVFTDGDVISGVVEQYTYEQIRNATSKEEVLNLLIPKNSKGSDYDLDKEEDDIKTQIAPIVSILSEIDDFEVVGEDVFLKGVKSIAIPSSIVAEFIRIVSEMDKNREKDYGLEYISKDCDLEEEFNALLMFTYKLLLNPIEQSRQDCLEYVKKYDIKLTNTGNMIMYRRIVSVGNSNKDLIDFVSKQYLKVKSWKKNPSNYEIFDDNGLILTQGYKRHDYNNFKGNLKDLYNSLSTLEENRYTDDYTKSYDIRIGEIYKIREEDIDINKHGSCGGALHIADGKVFNYRGFGDTPVVTLTDPRHIYKMDSGSKGKIGVKQMFIMAVTEQDENGDYIDIDSQTVVNFDELYHNQTIEELQKSLKNKSFEPISVSTEVTELSIKEVVNVTDILRNRIVEIV
jgi:hypothetical protein